MPYWEQQVVILDIGRGILKVRKINVVDAVNSTLRLRNGVPPRIPLPCIEKEEALKPFYGMLGNDNRLAVCNERSVPRL